MHRRGFFTLVTALLLPPLYANAQRRPAAPAANDPVALLRSELLRRARSLGTNHAIGGAWLAVQQPSPTLESVVNVLAAQLAALRLANPELADVPRLLAEQVRADFRNGETIRLNGWILSATEARLCGVACLLAGPHAASS